jgi:peptidyl-dipeptidase Dcp
MDPNLMTPYQQPTQPTHDNPLLQPWGTTSLALPDFARIRAEHFEPAFEQAMQSHRAELVAIATSGVPPTFDNTVAAFDRAGVLLARIDMVFHNLTASCTTPALQTAQRAMAPKLAAHDNAVYMDAALFAKVDALMQQADGLALTAEQRRMLERLHLDFVRAGAKLQGADKTRFAEIAQRLASLTTQFAQNVLADESGWHLELKAAPSSHGPDDFAGLPDGLRDAARQAAADRGLKGAVIPLTRSMVVPFLTFSERADLREALWRQYVARGAHEGAKDNRPIAAEIIRLRAEQAKLLGQASYADHSLADKMAKRPAAVMALLDDVWSRALVACERERQQLLALRHEARSGPAGAASTGTEAADLIEPWDWRFWSEKVRQRRYAIDDAEIKPYFTLERMTEAAFDCAGRLFGLRFKHRPDLVAYHADVRVYEVSHGDKHNGSPMGLFLHDNHARPGKRSGAWMSPLRWQSRTRAPAGAAGELPIILNNNNFNKPPPGEPTLLSFDDVRTLFHEFGHGLHGLMSNVTFDRLSGTQVLRDFVELPSQLFEHWALEPEVLRKHARHVHTNEPIPDALIERLQAARTFGQGYDTLRYTASALTDMALHSCVHGQTPEDVVAFESQVLRERGLPHGVGVNHHFTHFQHLFSSDGYAAGYYVYLWAEVLDADSFAAFKEAGDAFEPGVAAKLKQHIYSSGNSADPAQSFRAFRGRDPRVEPMLEDRGLIAAESERR